MTKEQREKCETIINTAMVSAGAISGLSLLPGSDATPLVGIQTTMIVAISSVFGVTFTNSCAVNLAKTAIAENLGKYLASQLIGWIPFAGNFIKGGVAAAITEELGWEVARDFDRN